MPNGILIRPAGVAFTHTEVVNSLQKVRFARAIFAGQHNVALVGLQLKAGIISKMAELELLDPNGGCFAVSIHGSLVAQSARQTRIGIST